MLKENEEIEEITFNIETYDESLWKEDVQPKLNCNVLQKRLMALRTELPPNVCRCAIMGAILSPVRDDPSQLFMTLSENENIIAEQSQHFET